MQTIGSRLDACRGVAPGFDALRLILAMSVVFFHASAIANNDLSIGEKPVLWLVGYIILAGFFTLGGFLVTGSAERLNLGNFLINRALRIFPALAVEVILCAVVLGAVFTTLPLKEYFSSPITWHYFTNIVGWINYQLPGVFKDHPTDVVNTSIWTIPYELGSYLLLTGFILFGLLKRPIAFLAFTIAFGVAGLAFVAIFGTAEPATHLMRGVALLTAGIGSRLVMGFLLGALIYLWRHKLPYDHRIAAVAAALCLVIGALGPSAWLTQPLLNVTAVPAIAYLIIYLGVSPLPLPWLLKNRDYSYGVYLYGWPIQQAVTGLFPDVHNPFLHSAISFPVIFLLAAGSWHFVERPMLRLRLRFSLMARARLQGEVDVAPKSNVEVRGEAPLQPPLQQ
ncbi:MAG: acyltransferase [Caulobacteraceae bacterium]